MAPDWWSEALAVWANTQGKYGKASRSPRGTARAMRTHTQETLQSAAPQEYSHIYKCTYVKQPMPSSSATRRSVIFVAFCTSGPLRSSARFSKAFL